MKYHFIGICGVSMSAIAVHLKHLGNYVQGSDINAGETSKKLENEGIKVFIGHNSKNVLGCDIVIYNFAIDKNNKEFAYAKKHNIKLMSRAQLLAFVASNYKNVISVAGSHGKTTTTAMLYSCLKYAGLSPTLHIGGVIEGANFGFVEGDKKYFITEACEYHDSFLTLKSKLGIIVSIESEHLDYFKTYKNELLSYQKFSNNCDELVTYADCDICAKNIKIIDHKYHFDVFNKEKFIIHIELKALGKYNISNALLVIKACKKLGIDNKSIYLGLKNCPSVKRRFEIISTSPTLIVHDYAHHPTQVKNTISTFRQCVKNKVLVVFQPHTYSRTKYFFEQFLNSFCYADEVFIIKTYPAREKYDKEGSAFRLYKTLKSKQHCEYFASFKRAKIEIDNKLKQGYSVLILGAGDIEKLAYTFLR